MNISSHLLHRSLASDRPPPGTELSQVVTACLYNDVNYDSEARFCANKSGLTGHSKGINCIGIDGTEGRWAVTGGADGSLLVWDLERQDREHDTNAVGFVRHKERSRHGVTSIQFNPHNASLFSTTSYSATLSIFSLSSSSPGQPSIVSAYPLDSHLYAHSISPASASAIIAVAGSSPHIRLIDPRTSSASQTLFGHISSVLSLVWSPIHSSILASGGADGSIRIWDIRFGASCLGTLDVNRQPQPANRAAGRAHEGGVNGLVWTANGRKTVSAGMDGKIRVWGMETGENTNVVFPPVIRNRYQASFPMIIQESPTGEGGGRGILWIGSEEHVIALDMEDGRMLKKLRIPKREARDGIGRITGLAERKGIGELYTCHGIRDGKIIDGGREGIARWRAEWLCGEEETEVEKTEKQRVLEEIFDKMTKGPVRFN